MLWNVEQGVRDNGPTLNLILQTVWGLLSITALLSTAVPPLRRLSLHGRLQSTRSSSVFMVRKSWFGFFYLLGWTWNGLVLVLAIMWSMSSSPLACSGPTLICLVCLQCHLFRRMLESVSITQFGDSTMHAAALILGTCHYIMVSLSIVLDDGARDPMSLHWFDVLVLLGGLSLFLVASAHQMTCNAVLASIKSSAISYAIPQGDWFDLTWSPLYWAEVLLYTSLVLLSQGRNSNLMRIALWVAINQSISAHRAKAWYVATFPAAAAALGHRATLIPHVW